MLEQVFRAIASTGIKYVVVLERAFCHTVLDEEDRKPVTSWNKALLIEAIKRWEVHRMIGH